MRSIMRARRLEIGYSQADIAKLVGISASFYAKIERGEKGPGADTLLALEAVLGVPAANLMKKTDRWPVPTGHT